MNVPTLRLQLIVDGKKKKFKTTKPSIFLGNAKLCDIKVDLDSTTSNFIEIKTIDDQIYIVNKHTELGLFLDDVEIEPKKKILFEGQILRFGEHVVDLHMELEGLPEASVTKITVKKEENLKPEKELVTKSAIKQETKTRVNIVPGKRPLRADLEVMLDPATSGLGVDILADEIQKSEAVSAVAKTNKTAQDLPENHRPQLINTSQLKPLSDPIIQQNHEISRTQKMLKELLESETGKHKLQVYEYEEKLQDLQSEYLKVKKDLRLYEYNCEELKEKQSYLRDEHTELKSLLSELEEKKTNIEQEVSLMHSQREMAGVELESFKNEKEHIQREIEEISIELKEQKEKHETFTKEMMDEYSAKKEEALGYYEQKVKEAAEYFDNKEAEFKQERKELQDEINSKIKDCDQYILNEKKLWQEQLKTHQGELELIKEKVFNEAREEKERIIKASEELALKAAEELAEFAENEKNEILSEAHSQKEQILSKYDNEGKALLEKLTNEAIHKKKQILKDAEAQKEKILKTAHSNKEELLQSSHEKAILEHDQILERAHLDKDEIISSAHEEKESILNSAHQEKEELLEEAHQEKVRLLEAAHQEKERLLEEAHQEKESILKEAHQRVEIEISEVRSKADAELEEIKKDMKIFEDRMNHSRNEFRKEEQESRIGLEKEIVNKRLDLEKELAKEQEKARAREQGRIKSNIQNVTENIVSLIEQNLKDTDVDAKKVIRLLSKDDLKEIVSDSFDVEAPMHHRKLGKFLLKNANAKETIKKFHKKALIITGFLSLVIITFLINPNFISDSKNALFGLISLDQSSNDEMVESMKQARLSRPKFNPERSVDLQDTYTDSILFTDQYRELVTTIPYKKKWTVELSLFVYREMLESEELVIKYMTLETALHNELLEAFNSIYEDHKDKGIERLNAIEKEKLPEMIKVFKNEKNWKLFKEFRKKFFQQYRENQ